MRRSASSNSSGCCRTTLAVSSARSRSRQQHVDGKSGVLVRADRLAWLGGETMVMEGQCHILSNARCLTEGIDVPALDAVLFLQPRKSQIDVVQAVGRVMRRAPGKNHGYIILPVVVPAGDDPASALDRNKRLCPRLGGSAGVALARRALRRLGEQARPQPRHHTNGPVRRDRRRPRDLTGKQTRSSGGANGSNAVAVRRPLSTCISRDR